MKTRRSQRVLSASKPSTLADNTLLDLYNFSYHTQPRIILCLISYSASYHTQSPLRLVFPQHFSFSQTFTRDSIRPVPNVVLLARYCRAVLKRIWPGSSMTKERQWFQTFNLIQARLGSEEVCFAEDHFKC